MTDRLDPRHRGPDWADDPAAPEAATHEDEHRGALGVQVGAIGGAQAGVPAASFPEAGLTPHDQPAEGGREEVEDQELA